MNQPECAHEHVHTEIKESSHCRYVPSTWERVSDDDPFETVTVKDVYIICDDCGDCLECLAGD